MKSLVVSLFVLFFVFLSQAQTPSPTPDAKITEVKSESVAQNDGITEVKKDDPKPTPNTTVAEKKKPFNVPKFSASPTIDGKLDDDIWKSAVKLVGFNQFQPGDGVEASKQTEVY